MLDFPSAAPYNESAAGKLYAGGGRMQPFAFYWRYRDAADALWEAIENLFAS